MTPEQLKQRTKKFALDVVKAFRLLPKTEDARVMGRQLLRSGTSLASNYRAVCRARSKAEFVAKIGVVVEEADETVFWLEMLEESGIYRNGPMKREANELLAILAASQRTARFNR
jgi:four helix bundle protein